MITNESELAVVKEQIELLMGALASLKATSASLHPTKYVLMAEPFVQDLAKLRSEVDAYLGIDAVRESDAAMVLSLEGEHVHLGDTRGSVMMRSVEAFRKGVRGILVAIESVKPTEGVAGQPLRWIEEVSDLPIAGVAAGSVRIFLGEPATSELYSDDKAAVLRHSIALLGTAAAASNSQEGLVAALANETDAVRNAVLLALRDLAPSRKSEVEAVSLGGRLMKGAQSPRVTKRTRASVAQAMKAMGSPEEELFAVEGRIREVDLDDNSFTLRQTPGDQGEWVCEFENEFSEDVVALLGERVAVMGERIKSKKPRMQVLAISPADEPDEPQSTNS